MNPKHILNYQNLLHNDLSNHQKVLFYFQLALTRVNYEIITIIGHEFPLSQYAGDLEMTQKVIEEVQ